MEIFDGAGFVTSGAHPVMMFALDARGPERERIGPPFVSWSAGAWQPSGAIRAVDAYVPGRWYSASIERSDKRFRLEVSGEFRFGGQRTYSATIDGAKMPIWGEGAPDWFMFGDPHENYYEGEVYYDDVRLEVWR
jgi:hypothetical protein